MRTRLTTRRAVTILVAALAGGVAAGAVAWTGDDGSVADGYAASSTLPDDLTSPPQAATQGRVVTSAPDGPDASSPEWVSIPRLGVRMRVVPTGVAPDGAMALPRSPEKLGWYKYGGRPLDREGSTVVAGHVDTAADGPGPLATLGGLRRGDRIDVVAGGERVRYAVTSITRIDKDKIDLDAVFAHGGRPRLHLVTCWGAYVRSSGGYQDNLVVAARRVTS